MIGFLKGKIAYHTRDSVLIDVQGVGYQVRLSERHLSQLNLSPGEPIELTTHLLPREDALELYGFSSPQEKEIFLQLTRVSGIGPRTALAIFSALELQDVIRAVVSNQPKVLSQAPGVGAKTAQRIILELKEKFSKMVQELNLTTPENSILPAGWLEEIEMTLLALGYEVTEISQALENWGEQISDLSSADEAIRFLLSKLS